MFAKMKKEIELIEEKPENFKQHQLPLARIKKIMKSDEDVKVSSD
jgi:nuclear transcription factor Y gamma